jgi:hypothetical protein
MADPDIQMTLIGEKKEKIKPKAHLKKSYRGKNSERSAFIEEKIGKPLEQRKPIINSRQKKTKFDDREIIKENRNFTIKKRNSGG